MLFTVVNPTSTPLKYTADQQTRTQLLVMSPKGGTSEQSALSAAQGTIKSSLESEAYRIANGLGDRVDQLSLWGWVVQVSDVRAYLYPVYIGSVNYDGEIINAHVDAITGAVWVKPPAAVKKARLNAVRRMWYAMIIIGGGIAGFAAVQPGGVEVNELLSVGGITLGGAVAFVEILIVPITRWGQNRKQ